MLAVVDWTNVLDSLIAAMPAIIAALVAAIYAHRTHTAIQTPSGDPIGKVVEYAHDTTIANNLLLSKKNGPTKPADPHTLHDIATSTPPQVPNE